MDGYARDVIMGRFPHELQTLTQWVGWKYENDPKNPDKLKKVPKNPRTGGNARPNDPTTWGTMEQAFGRAENSRFDGVGFMFHGEHFGIDIDHCRDVATGTLDATAIAILDAVPSYVEVSPSGTGVHIICNGGYYNGDKRTELERYYYFSKVPIGDDVVVKMTLTTYNRHPYKLELKLNNSDAVMEWLRDMDATQDGSNWRMGSWDISLTECEDNSIDVLILPSNNIVFRETYGPEPTPLWVAPTPRPPVPTPIPASYPIEFQGTKGYNDGNYSYVEGYAKNIGDTSIEYVLIRVTFTDNSRNVLDIGTDYVGTISKLRPGDREHFSVMVRELGNDWRYRMEIESYR